MTQAHFLGLLSSLFILVLVLELVRQRKLKEEYSWIWLLMSLGYFSIATIPQAPHFLAMIIGVERRIASYTFVGFVFLFLVGIQLSVRLSTLSTQNKNLAQQLAILDSELHYLHKSINDDKPDHRKAENNNNSEREESGNG